MPGPPPTLDDPFLGGIEAGERIEKYVVEAQIGRGGMAVVYRVRHVQLDSLHALKVVEVPSAAMRARLLQEGRAQGALRHPNVVPVTDVVDVDGSPGLVMDYVDGPTLHALLETRALGVDEARRLGRDVLQGVAAAHRAGFVHRDLKPGNVLIAIERDGLVAKVTDFGLAKVLARSPGTGLETRSGVAMGTPAFMSPEQIRDASRVDHRSDVFSLGALLYTLACGRPPFRGDDLFAVMSQVTAGRYTPPRELAPALPDGMVRAIEGALVVDPGQRLPDCDALLRLWTEEQPSGGGWDAALVTHAREIAAAPKPGGSESTFLVTSPAAAPRRRPWTLMLAAVAILSVGAVGVSALWSWSTSEASRPAHLDWLATVRPLDVAGGYHPALSPDGHELLYTDGTDVFVRRIDGDRSVAVTAEFEPAATRPTWSPDGQRVAFVADQGIWVMGALGEDPHRVVERGFAPAWSPDGRHIAYVTEDIPDPNARLAGRSYPWVVDVETGEARQLYDLDAMYVAWSPDGEHLAIQGDFGIHIGDLEGAEPLRVAIGGGQVAWDAGGDGVFAIAPEGEGTQILWTSASDPDAPFVVRLNHTRTHAYQLTVSADSRRMVFGGSEDRMPILAVSLDPRTGLPTGPARPITRETGFFTSPAVAPDGTRIAWCDDNNGFVFLAAPDGSAPRRLGSIDGSARGATWDPDGERILVYGQHGRTWGIWAFDVASGARTLLSDTGDRDVWMPRIAPDGERIALVITQPAVETVIIDLDEPWEAQIVEATGGPFVGWIGTEWAFEGDRMTAGNGEDAVAWLVPETGEVVPIGEGYYPAPGPDGRVYVGEDDRVWLVDAEGTRTEVLSTFPATIPITPSLAVSPDGRSLYLAAHTRRHELWRVDFGPPR